LMASALPRAGAEVLGTIGPTYPIGEQNLLEQIASRLQDKERSGALRRLQEESRTRAIAAINNPPAVSGLQVATAARTYYFDPSVALPSNVVDAAGQLLYAAGTVKNPLDVVSMSKHLLFFDARDPRQVEKAREVIDSFGGRVKPVLVGGSYLQLMKAWQISVYYDQKGSLTSKLGIRAVPALVSQEGKRLRIDEMVVR